MRFLVPPLCSLLILAWPVVAVSGELHLRLLPEPAIVHLGDPFTLRVEIVNETEEQVRVLPELLPSRDYLTMTFKDCNHRILPVSEFTGGNPTDVQRADYVLLRPNEYFGRDMRFSPSANDFFVGELKLGEVIVQASLSLREGNAAYEWDDGIKPTQKVLTSLPISMCFFEPNPEAVRRQRRHLKSKEILEVLEALAFFEIVQDRTANGVLLDTLGPHKGWCTRYEYDAFAALRALRNQHRRENLPYFEDCLAGRHAKFAQRAIDEIRLPPARECDRCGKPIPQ